MAACTVGLEQTVKSKGGKGVSFWPVRAAESSPACGEHWLCRDDTSLAVLVAS